MATAEINGLVVRYGAFEALKGLTMSLPEGCIGLLGPNGAGKTTLIKTLLGFVKPTAGAGTVLGHDIGRDGLKIRQMVGYMPEQDCHIPGMSGVDFVAYTGELAGMPTAQALRRAHEVLEYVGLGESRYRQVETYSTGMKQRAKFAQALVHGPKLLLLDEPTNGLDPRGREEMLGLVRSVSQEKGLSVVVSSHLLKDVERTCDSVVVVLGGKLIAQGTIEALTKIAGRPMDIELKTSLPEFPEACRRHGLSPEPLKSGWRVAGLESDEETSRRVFAAARDCGAQIRRLVPGERSLEEAFLEAVHA